MISSVTSKNIFYIAFSSVFLIALSVAIYFDVYWILLVPISGILFYSGLLSPFSIFLLLLFCIPFSSEFNFSSTLATDLPDEPLMWLLSIVFLVQCLPVHLDHLKKSISHPVLLILLLWIGWIFLSTLFSTNQEFSFKFILAKTWYLFAFVAIPLIYFQKEKNIYKGAIFLLTGVTIVASLILLNHGKTGFSFATVNEAVKPFFRNHVNYGALIVCCVPLVVAVLSFNRNFYWRIAGLLILSVLLTALAFSYSRGAWLALVTGVAAWWLIKKRLLLIAFICSIILGLAAIWWLKTDDRYLDYAHDYETTIFHEDFKQHFISTYKLKDLSTEERFYRWIAGVRMIKDNWLTGTGPNTFYPLYKEYTVPAYKTWVSDNPERSTVHNYFLLTAIEQGLPGLIFFLLLCGAVIYFIEKGYHRSALNSQKIILITTGSVFIMILTLNFLSDLIETDKVGSLFFLCVAIAVSKSSSHIQRISQSIPE